MFTYLITALLAATSSSSLAHAYSWSGNAPNGTQVNSTAPASYPKWDGVRCNDTATHKFEVEQAWERADNYQITPDCFAYGVGGYAALHACALRNLCFGNCTRTYKECVTEWMDDTETHAAHKASAGDEERWEKLPLDQYFHFNEISCECKEVEKCRHVNC